MTDDNVKTGDKIERVRRRHVVTESTNWGSVVIACVFILAVASCTALRDIYGCGGAP